MVAGPSNVRAREDERPALTKIFGLDEVKAAVRRAEKKIEAFEARGAEEENREEDPPRNEESTNTVALPETQVFEEEDSATASDLSGQVTRRANKRKRNEVSLLQDALSLPPPEGRTCHGDRSRADLP